MLNYRRVSVLFLIEIFHWHFHWDISIWLPCWYSFPFRFSLKNHRYVQEKPLTSDKIWPAGSMPAWQGCQGCQGCACCGCKSHPEPIKKTSGDFTVCYRRCFIYRWICLLYKDLRMVIVHSYIKLPDGSLVSWYIYIYIIYMCIWDCGFLMLEANVWDN